MNVSIQLISLASRDCKQSFENVCKKGAIRVSIQLISLASRDNEEWIRWARPVWFPFN